jgi:hypothetical protein
MPPAAARPATSSRVPTARHTHGARASGRAGRLVLAALVLAAQLPGAASAQELEPRRWSHLPTGMNFLGAGYAYTDADTSDSPALKLEDVRSKVHTVAARYIRTFELLGRTARAEVGQTWRQGSWNGLLDGEAASTSRSGWGDTVARLAVNVVGAPPLEGKAYASYRASRDVETLVGVALSLHLPTGEYMKDRLINLGSNRFVIRPQVGVVHNRGNWSMELTGAAWLYTDNDSFFNGNRLETEPLLTLQGHLTYNFRPGLWASAGVGYGHGARSTLNGDEKDDRKQIVGWTLSAGYPLARDLGISVGYVGRRRRSTNGADTDTLTLAVSHFW